MQDHAVKAHPLKQVGAILFSYGDQLGPGSFRSDKLRTRLGTGGKRHKADLAKSREDRLGGTGPLEDEKRRLPGQDLTS